MLNSKCAKVSPNAIYNFSSLARTTGRFGNCEYILPPQKESDKGKKTLVLDLDETLVHSTFQPEKNANIIIPVETTIKNIHR